MGHDLIDVSTLDNRGRYQLLTSLVVPRPIGWISTRSPGGVHNLAPFSYFAALSPTPLLVGASIGHRRGTGPKDTLVNIRETGAFCVNVVTEKHLEAMNATSVEADPSVDEFQAAGLDAARASTVDAPYVADCPAVLECRLFKEVELGEALNTLVIGEVLAIRLDPALARSPGTWCVESRPLAPVARLWGDQYSLLGEIRVLPRP